MCDCSYSDGDPGGRGAEVGEERREKERKNRCIVVRGSATERERERMKDKLSGNKQLYVRTKRDKVDGRWKSDSLICMILVDW